MYVRTYTYWQLAVRYTWMEQTENNNDGMDGPVLMEIAKLG